MSEFVRVGWQMPSRRYVVALREERRRGWPWNRRTDRLWRAALWHRPDSDICTYTAHYGIPYTFGHLHPTEDEALAEARDMAAALALTAPEDTPT
jgi:hypothetical protein